LFFVPFYTFGEAKRMVIKMKNKTAVLTSPGKIILEKRNIPSIKEDEVLLRIHCLGLCGSDLHMYTGTYKGPHKYPVVIGHEYSGEIIKTGKNVNYLKAGDCVTGDAAIWCGKCRYCQFDKNICINIEKRGLTIDGCAAEYINIKEKYLYKLPKNVDFELGSLTEPFAVGNHAIIKGMGEDPYKFADKKVLIMGAGPIGAATLMLLVKEYGFKNVFINDIVDYRLELSKKFGGIIFKPEKQDINNNFNYNKIYNIDGFDYIFESTGVNSVLDRSFMHINPLGTAISLAPIREMTLTGGFLVLKSIKLIGSLGGAGDLPKVLNAFSKDPDYYKQMITHRFEFNDILNAMETQNKEDKRLQVLININ